MSLLGVGSDILPNEEPLRLRAAFLRREPRIQTPAIERRIPAARPGKKPARTAVTGNLSQLGEITTGVFVEGEDVVVELGEEFLDVEEVGAAELEDELVAGPGAIC